MDNSKIKSRFSIEVNKRFIQRVVGALGALCIIILLVGMLASLIKHKVSADSLSEFPENSYLPASNVQSGSFSIIDYAYFIRVLKLELESNTPSINSFNSRINQELGGKKVIVAKTSFHNSQPIEKLFSQEEAIIKFKIDAIDKQISGSSYYSYSALQDKQSLEVKLGSITKFKEAFKLLSIGSAIVFPVSGKHETFEFAAGIFDHISVNQSSGLSIFVKEANPAFSKDYLLQFGWSEEDLSRIDFREELELLKEIKARDKKLFSSKINQEKRALKQVVKIKRREFRAEFYKRWFAVLLNLIVSIGVLFLLLQYIKIIRRKGLPKKTTHEVYFATNMTSLFLRWLALGIAVVGFVLVSLNFFIFMIVPEKVPFIHMLVESSPVISELSFAFALMVPLLYLVVTVLLSWFFILLSEFICFISNVYHVLFEKAYRNETSNEFGGKK